MTRWALTGTPAQQAIAREAFARIKFDFALLTMLPGTPELGWTDLNARQADAPRMHGTDLHDGDKPDKLEGELNGRRWVMGVIYTQSGRIYLDVRLEQHPDLAMAVVGAEIAHAVDFFLPMTETMREALLSLWNVPGTTWWEKVDYGAEYYSLGGEAFMHEFVGAYTDLEFGSTAAFAHDANVEPADVRRILGLERTDYVPTPAPHDHFVSYGTSKVYHESGHKVRSKSLPLNLHDLTGYRPCKVCKPC